MSNYALDKYRFVICMSRFVRRESIDASCSRHQSFNFCDVFKRFFDECARMRRDLV